MRLFDNEVQLFDNYETNFFFLSNNYETNYGKKKRLHTNRDHPDMEGGRVWSRSNWWLDPTGLQFTYKYKISVIGPPLVLKSHFPSPSLAWQRLFRRTNNLDQTSLTWSTSMWSRGIGEFIIIL